MPRASLACWLAIVLLVSASAQAQVRVPRPDVRVDARYDVVEGGALARRWQAALRIGAQVDAGPVRVVGFVASGDDFASRWATVYDAHDGGSALADDRPRLRRLYLERETASYRVQAGAVPPVKATISPTGLDPVGWIDGVRAEWYAPSGGTLEGVAGRLGDIETPSVLARPFVFAHPKRLNYAEVEFSQPFPGGWGAEASVEYLRALYLRGEVRAAAGAAEVIVEALYTPTRDAVVVGTTLALDALRPFGAPGRAEVAVRHAFKDRDIGLRGELADDFVTFGHSFTAELDVAVSPRHGLTANAEAIVAEGVGVTGLRGAVYTRFNVGLGWRLR